MAKRKEVKAELANTTQLMLRSLRRLQGLQASVPKNKFSQFKGGMDDLKSARASLEKLTEMLGLAEAPADKD